MAKKCNTYIDIPERIVDICNGEKKSTDCVVYENAITYLDLPENSSMTDIVRALLESLIDARQRIEILEQYHV